MRKFPGRRRGWDASRWCGGARVPPSPSRRHRCAGFLVQALAGSAARGAAVRGGLPVHGEGASAGRWPGGGHQGAAPDVAAGRMRGGAPGAVDDGVSVPRTAGGRAAAGRLCRHRRGTRPGRRRAATEQRAGCLVGGRAGAFGRAGPRSRGGAEPCSVPVLDRLGSRRAGAVAHVRRARRRLERLSGTAVAGPRRRSRPRSAARPCRRPGDRARRLAPREPELARPAPARRARLGQRDLPA